MHRLNYCITSLAPLILSARTGDANMTGTYRHIPGTAVLGLLVARYLQKKSIHENAHLKDEFHSCFLKGSVQFGGAFVCREDDYGDVHILFPTPHSIHREKRGDRLFDLLLHNPDDDDPQTKPVGGFCHLDGKKIRFADVETGVNFHHARDRQKGIPKDEKIFNYEFIQKGQLFQGQICGNKKNLASLVDAVGGVWEGRLGRSRSSQYGRIRFEFLETEPIPMEGGIEMDGPATLTLISDTIVTNENGFAVTDTAELETSLGVKIDKAFIRQGTVETHVNVWGLKKPSEVCFTAGSCFLLANLLEKEKKRLNDMVKIGIGVRTHEGYGRFKIGWHTEGELSEEFWIDDSGLKKPDGPVPEAARNIAVTLIRQTFLKHAALRALDEVQQFSPPFPTPSLIGRLNALVLSHKPENFSNQIERLKNQASEKLRKCRGKSQTLLVFLRNKKMERSTLQQDSRFPDYADLMTEIDFPKNGEEEELNTSLFREYFSVFFSALRKRALIGGGK